MFLNIEIELYKEHDGRTLVFLAHDGSSGCKYDYRDKRELKQIIKNYVVDVIDELDEKEITENLTND